MRRNLMPVYFNENYKINKKKLKMKKNAMDPVNFEEEKKNDPKYKTELCKSFMETNFCCYGNKCRFAHGYKELVVKKQINHYKQKTCNSFFNKGYCPYGSRCNFKHDERKLEQIGVPYYFSHLISLHLPQLKTCSRLNVFTDISSMKEKEIEREKEKEREKEREKEQILIKFNNDKNNEQIIKEEEKENKKEKDELSISFSSEISSQASSGTTTPVKEKEKDFDKDNDKEETEDEDADIDSNKIKEFFLKDFNFELDFFSTEN